MLPVRRASVDLVLRLIELDRGPGWVLRGKTGLKGDGKRAVGWLVGSTEHAGRRYIYPTIVLGRSTSEVMPLRRPTAEELLGRHGALPPVRAAR